MVFEGGIFEFVFDLGNFREFNQRYNDQVALNQGPDFVVVKLFFEINLFLSNENATRLLHIEFILV
jgi:hypothetical protein